MLRPNQLGKWEKSITPSGATATSPRPPPLPHTRDYALPGRTSWLSEAPFLGGNKPHQRAGMLLSSPSSANPQHPSPRDPTEGPHVLAGCWICLNTRRAGRVERDRCTVNWIWPLRQKGRGLGRRRGITGGGRSCPQGLLSWGIIGGG